jgi:hypothetical protein
MSNKDVCEALRKLSIDKSTTKHERAAAKKALEALTGKKEDSKSDIVITKPSTSNIELTNFVMPKWQYVRTPYYVTTIKMLERAVCIIERPVHYDQDVNRGNHEVWGKYVDWRAGEYSDARRDEFLLQIYCGLGIQKISVVVSEEKLFSETKRELIEIYDGHNRGYREGPWWPKLDSLAQRWMVERNAIDQQRREEAAAEEQAAQNKKNDMFSRYVRSSK